MILEFIQVFEQQLWTAGYTVNSTPRIPGVNALISVVSPRITSVGSIKFINYYLFLDWDNDLFGRLESLIAAQKSFREVVNKDFHVPHGWRMTLPNIVVAAVSSNEFPQEAVSYVQSKYQIPWQGGEVGQMMLFDLQNHIQYCHVKKHYKQTGSIPLGYAVDELFEMFKVFSPDARCYSQ
jgi:hypothetical protein